MGIVNLRKSHIKCHNINNTPLARWLLCTACDG